MNELYWITRLDAVNGFFTALVIVAGIATIGLFVAWCDDCDVTKIRKWLFWSIPALLLGISGLVFTPTTKQALIIYGVGGTIDYIKQNDKAQKLPDKVIDALDKYLDSMNNKEENNYGQSTENP